MVDGRLGTVTDGFAAIAAGLEQKRTLTGKALKEKMRNAVVWLVRSLPAIELSEAAFAG
jgi:hypothetical protein